MSIRPIGDRIAVKPVAVEEKQRAALYCQALPRKSHIRAKSLQLAVVMYLRQQDNAFRWK